MMRLGRIFIFLIFLFQAAPVLVSAYDATPRCFLDIERTFFRSKTIYLSLQYFLNDVSAQGQWDPFVRHLVNQNYLIHNKIRYYGKKMTPNPMENPFDPNGAIDLLRIVTREIFMDAMFKFRPLQERDWEPTFNYVFDAEYERLNACSKNLK